MSKDLSIISNRVVATVFILLCHIIKYYTFIPAHNILGQLFNVGVHIFIIISGFLYGKKSGSAEYGKKDYIHFLFQRYQRVVFPCQTWAIILFFATFCSNLPNTIMVLFNLQGLRWIFRFNSILDGGPLLSHTWFLTVIFICYMLIPVFNRLSALLNLGQLALFYVFAIVLEYARISTFLFLLFLIAFKVGKERIDLHLIRLRYVFLCLFVALFVRILGNYYFDGTVFYNQIISGLSHQMLAWCIFIIVDRLVFVSKIALYIAKSNFVSFLDRHSFSIYLVHYFMIPWLFTNFSIWKATIVFVIASVSLAVVLDLMVTKMSALLFK